MPFGAVTLRPGVDLEKTQSLNEAGVSISQIIRYRDGIIETLGGWVNFVSFTIPSTVRDLHAWQDAAAVKHLGVGATSGLFVITEGSNQDVTPQQSTTNFTPNFSISSGSFVVTITDNNSSGLPSVYNSIFFNTPVSIGNLLLNGAYDIATVTSSITYTIISSVVASTTIVSSGKLPTFSISSGSGIVTVSLSNNNFLSQTGLFYTFYAGTKVGSTADGLFIQGPYQVQTIIDSTNFTINSPTQSSTTATATMNDSGGNDIFTKVLLHFNGVDTSTVITDSNNGGSAHVWTANGNAQIDTAQSKFGGASCLFDGAGDYVTTPDSADFTLGSGDWTVDLWFNPAAFGAAGRLCGQVDATNAAALSAFSITMSAANTLTAAISDGVTFILIAGTTAYVASTWHHLALVRSGNVIKLFLDGVQEGGDVAFAGSVNDSASAFSVGRAGALNIQFFNGWIDEFRLSVGVARWAANFTPPASQYGTGGVQLVYYVTIGPQITGTGFGGGGFGLGGFGGAGGGAVSVSGTPISAEDWSMDNWGQVLLACPKDGAIYTWSPDSGFVNAQVISQAPFFNGGIFISMPQQILVAWRSCQSTGTQDNLRVRWSDAGDYTNWEVTNQTTAGSFQIPTGSIIRGGLQASTQGIIWTDVDVWVMRYVGGEVIFNFNRVGSGCGLVGPHAASTLSGTVYWMSQNNFYVMSDQGVQILPCTVWDFVFQNMDTANIEKVRCAPNSAFNEITWFFPSSTSDGENDSYVKYDTVERVWDFGAMPRTAWVDVSVLGNPIGADPLGQLLQHEEGELNSGVGAPSFQSGWWTITEGSDFAFVDFCIPDFKFGTYSTASDATITLTFYAVDYPGDTVRSYGPYTITAATEYITPRIRGRLMSVLVQGNGSSYWRIGKIRYRYALAGRR